MRRKALISSSKPVTIVTETNKEIKALSEGWGNIQTNFYEVIHNILIPKKHREKRTGVELLKTTIK